MVSCAQVGLPPLAIRQRGAKWVMFRSGGKSLVENVSFVTYVLSMNKSVPSISLGASCQSMAFMTEPVGVTTRLEHQSPLVDCCGRTGFGCGGASVGGSGGFMLVKSFVDMGCAGRTG